MVVSRQYLVKSPITYTIGRLWQFNFSKQASDDELPLAWKFLECRNCRLRRLYHALAYHEIKKLTSVSAREGQCDIRHRHFHSLQQLLKAILWGYHLQARSRPLGKLALSCLHSAADNVIHSLSVSVFTGFHAFRDSDLPWVCKEHGRELLVTLLYAADNKEAQLDEQLTNACKSRSSVSIFPEGVSSFYRRVSETERREALAASPKFPAPDMLLFQSCVAFSIATRCWGSSAISVSVAVTEDLSPDCCVSSEHVTKANQQWNESYASDESVPERASPADKKRVHFPMETPITKIHHLIRYATAAQLARKDNFWLLAMRDRLWKIATAQQVDDDSSDCDTGDNDSSDKPNLTPVDAHIIPMVGDSGGVDHHVSKEYPPVRTVHSSSCPPTTLEKPLTIPPPQPSKRRSRGRRKRNVRAHCTNNPMVSCSFPLASRRGYNHTYKQPTPSSHHFPANARLSA